ncbi:CP21A hydroxylase, partial [Certhia brachydactyla]|nr:CP21A hydroxylase [Certhia brachydactyla]
QELRSHGGAPLDPFEVFTFHTCSTIARLLFGDLVPPPEELRAFSRCLGELLQVWGRSSVQVLDLLPLLRVRPWGGHQERARFGDGFGVPRAGWGVLGDLGVQGGPEGRGPGLGMVLGFPGAGWGLVWVPRAGLGVGLGFPGQLQARLRAELKGAQGPPTPGDVGRLPLLQATVTETLRLRPPAPLALPHCALRHTSLGGLPVVAGTVLVPNLLAAQQDPDIWEHPELFLPERFLSPGVPSRSLLPFGCGARSCPGEGLARAELFVFLGLILREFRLEPGPGGLPGLRGSPGTVLRCPPFHLRMVPCQPP